MLTLLAAVDGIAEKQMKKRENFSNVVTIDKTKPRVDKIPVKCLIISSGHTCPIPWSKQQSPQSSNTELMCRVDL